MRFNPDDWDFIYDPNGVAGGKVYTDWAKLVAAMAASPGLKRLCIPPGTYDSVEMGSK